MGHLTCYLNTELNLERIGINYCQCNDIVLKVSLSHTHTQTHTHTQDIIQSLIYSIISHCYIQLHAKLLEVCLTQGGPKQFQTEPEEQPRTSDP